MPGGQDAKRPGGSAPTLADLSVHDWLASPWLRSRSDRVIITLAIDRLIPIPYSEIASKSLATPVP
jgi:hypothetical protein